MESNRNGEMVQPLDELKLAHGKIESGAFALFAFEPYFTVIILHNFFADSQTYSGAVIVFVVVQALEHLEDSCGIFCGDTDTVIRNREGVIVQRVGPVDIDFGIFTFIKL